MTSTHNRLYKVENKTCTWRPEKYIYMSKKLILALRVVISQRRNVIMNY